MAWLAAHPTLSPWFESSTNSSTSRGALCRPRYPLRSWPTLWIQCWWVMNFFLTLFFNLRRPDNPSVTSNLVQQEDLLDSLEWVKQRIKLLLCLNPCYEWPNCGLCFMKYCSCCDCLGGNRGIWCMRQQLKWIRLCGWPCMWAWVRDYCRYVRDFLTQRSVLICSSWRNVWYIKVAVLIPTAKPVVSTLIFGGSEKVSILPSSDYTNNEA